MKLTTLLLITAFISGYANTSAQSLTLSGKDIPLKRVFNAIKQQTGYVVFTSKEILADSKPVSLTVYDMPLINFLDFVLRNQSINYRIEDKTIMLTKKLPTRVQFIAIPSMGIPLLPPPFDVTVVVQNTEGLPLEGASIRVKGTLRGITTDVNGRAVVKAVAPNSTFVISFTGYSDKEVAVDNNKLITIKLIALSKNLDDIVVIGYGTQKKKDITGSVASVKVEDMQKAPVASFENALAGRVAGVQVSSNDGQPGAASNIVIRGNNSLTQDNTPLYVVDGFPIENPTNNVVNPADIESINILKDASATAIYGARGANGVIVITTKRGKNAPASVNIDSYTGFNTVLKKQALLNPYEFVKYNEQFFPVYTDSTYLKDTTLEAYRNVPGIDWQDMLERSGLFQNNNVAVRGGSNGGNYSISLGSTDQRGIIINSGFKRYTARVVLDQQVNKALKVGININYAYTKAFGTVISSYGGSSPVLSVLGSAYAYRPIAGSIADPNIDQSQDDLENSGQDPSINASTDFRYNPLKNAQNTNNNRYGNTIVANGYFQYQFLKNLTLKVSGGVNRAFNETDLFYGSNTSLGDIHTAQGLFGPNGTVTNNQLASYLNENTLMYNTTFAKDHQLNVLAGFTLQGQDSRINGYKTVSIPNENLGISGIDEGTTSLLTSAISSNTLQSFLGRINYNYKSTYYFTTSFRADGSSKFAPVNHWSYFPSGAISWRISNESFMNRLLPVINDAKLRASYGTTGNNRVTDFAYLSTITLPIRNGYTFDQTYYQGAILSALGNQKLKWETTNQIDLGLDLELLKSRISFTADYYKKVTSNLLLAASLPGSTGFTSSFANVGKVQNSGLEFTLNTINITSKTFTWNSNFNISFNRNKVLALVDGQESLLSSVAWSTNSYSTLPSYIAKIGQPIAMFYGYVFDGVYQYSDFNKTSTGTYVLKDNIPNNTTLRNTIQPGNIKLKDINGDGVVDTKDQTAIGNPNPKLTGGFSNNFAYKGFELNVLLQWSYGNQIENANRYVFEGGIAQNRNQFASFADRWSPENQGSLIPINNGPNIYSSRVIEDGSYLRLKTVQLGYKIPLSLLKKLNIKNFRVYVSGQNLATWTKYTGSDPEVSAFNSALTPGFDFSAYPYARTFTVGLSVTL